MRGGFGEFFLFGFIGKIRVLGCFFFSEFWFLDGVGDILYLIVVLVFYFWVREFEFYVDVYVGGYLLVSFGIVAD